MTLKNCTFVNTGRYRCNATTQVLAVDLTEVINLSISIPNTVRDGNPGDIYVTPIGTTLPSCGSFCDSTTFIITDSIYESFPPCKPFYTLPVTFDYWSGCGQAADEIVTANCPISLACQADRILTNGTLSSGVTSPLSGTVNIQGQFIVDADFTFEDATVRMDPGAEIVVQQGVNLYIVNSTFESCQGVMWKSITANEGAIINVQNSFINDSEQGLTALNSSIISPNSFWVRRGFACMSWSASMPK